MEWWRALLEPVADQERSEGLRRLRAWAVLRSGFLLRPTTGGLHPADLALNLLQGVLHPCVVLFALAAAPHLLHTPELLFVNIHMSCLSIMLYAAFLNSLLKRQVLSQLFRLSSQQLLFVYSESLSPVQLGYIKSFEDSTRRFSRRFTGLILFVSLFNTFENSAKALVSSGQLNPAQDSPVNFNLPAPVLMPIQTSSALGFGLSYVFLLLCIGMHVVTVIATMTILYSIPNLAKLNIQVLNESLRNLEGRARSRLGPGHASEEWQDCLLGALRENIQHHQAILEFTKLMNSYLGTILFVLFLVISLLIAICAYLLVSLRDLHNFKMFFFLFSELVGMFCACYTGQTVTTESSQLLATLYGAPWPESARRFRVHLHIMLTNSLRPLTLNSHFIARSASFHTFALIANSTYTYFNLLRNLLK